MASPEAPGPVAVEDQRADRERAALFGLNLEDFTAARNALAARLKKGGDDAGAAAVKALKKPTLPAWVVNQLSRRSRETVLALNETAAQIEVSSSAKQVRELTRKRHELVARLTDQARSLLEEGGRSPTATVLSKVTQTLYALSGEDGRRALEEGTLQREVETAGFEAALGFSGAGDEAPEVGQDALDDADGAEDEALGEAKRLEAERLEAERLDAERLDAERLDAKRLDAKRLDAKRLEDEAVGAEEELAAVLRDVEEARRAVKGAEDDLRRALESAQEAQRRAKASRREADRARRTL